MSDIDMDFLLCSPADYDEMGTAIEMDDRSTVSRLIAKSAVNVRVQHGDERWPPLSFAAAYGRIEIMAMLLDAGASVYAGDAYGRSVLYFLVSRGHFDALKWFLDRGCVPNVNYNENGDQLLLAVARNRIQDERIAILLLDSGAPLDSLSDDELMALVIPPRSTKVIQCLVNRGVDMNKLRDRFSYSLLHRAVECDGDVAELLHALVAAGVDVNTVNRHRETPLHRAALKANVTSLRVLIELGADIDRQDLYGGTALHTLGGRGERKGACVELLLAFGANFRVVDRRGLTPVGGIVERKEFPNQLCAFLAAGAELESESNVDQLPTAVEIEAARQRIARRQLDLVRHRALEICIGLQPLNLDALRLCEIMIYSSGVCGSMIAFHQWWKIATFVKHFHQR